MNDFSNLDPEGQPTEVPEWGDIAPTATNQDLIAFVGRHAHAWHALEHDEAAKLIAHALDDLVQCLVITKATSAKEHENRMAFPRTTAINPDVAPDVQADIANLSNILLDIRMGCLLVRGYATTADEVLRRIASATTINPVFP